MNGAPSFDTSVLHADGGRGAVPAEGGAGAWLGGADAPAPSCSADTERGRSVAERLNATGQVTPSGDGPSGPSVGSNPTASPRSASADTFSVHVKHYVCPHIVTRLAHNDHERWIFCVGCGRVTQSARTP